MIFEVFFDVETKKLFRDTVTGDPSELGVSVVSVYSRVLNESLTVLEATMQSFWERSFSSMWPLFQKADRIIGFNTKNFDIPALSPYAPPDFKKMKHFDILEKVKNASGKRLSLNALAKNTLGTQKTDIGTNAVMYWNKGDKENLTKLQQYCEMDVAITRDLYDYAVQKKHLKYLSHWNTVITIPLDFSYPSKMTGDKQFSLF